jgi:ligand-binding sensor domain-containing protein
MNFFKIAFFFTITLLFQNSTHAQDWVSYQSQQQINDLVDKDNELLMATDAGLVVLNKSTLEKTIFNKANSNLGNNHIQTITQAPDGQTWVGTYDLILARFDGTDFQDTTIPESDEYNQYTKLYDFKIAPNGDFWLATSDGVFHRQGEYWSHYDENELGPDFFEAWDIEINNQGEVFVASNEIHKYVNGEWFNISDTIQLLTYLDADLFFSKSGDLYIAGDLDRIVRFDGEQWEEFDNGGLNGTEVIGFTEDVEGNVYFNTLRDGIYKLENNTWMPYVDAQTEEFNNYTSFFYIDEQGNRWLNKYIYLSVNKNGNIESTLISQHTLETNRTNNIHKGENGHLFFITNWWGSTISVLDTDGNWSVLPLPTTFAPFENIRDILFIANDDIWLASYYGLYHYNGVEWIFEELSASYSIAMDSQGKVYVAVGVSASEYKIYIVNGGVTTEYNVNNSPMSDLIISGLGVDANDNLWIASFNWDGEAAIQKVATDDTWTTYTKSEYPAINRPAGDFHFDSDGNMWIPSDQAGAIKFNGTDWTNPIMGNLEDIENYTVSSIDSDAAGKLYFAHQYGVTTFHDGVWGDLIIEDVPHINSSIGSNIEFDNDGTLWWASNSYGIFSYTPGTTTAIFSDFEIAEKFSIYPNPAGYYTVLDFTTQERAIVKAFIYNNQGQLLSSLDLGQFSKGAFQQEINLADFPNGFYSIRLQVNDRTYSKKIVINH